MTRRAVSTLKQPKTFFLLRSAPFSNTHCLFFHPLPTHCYFLAPLAWWLTLQHIVSDFSFDVVSQLPSPFPPPPPTNTHLPSIAYMVHGCVYWPREYSGQSVWTAHSLGQHNSGAHRMELEELHPYHRSQLCLLNSLERRGDLQVSLNREEVEVVMC